MLKILCIDDDVDILRTYKMMLSKKYDFTGTDDPEEGLELAMGGEFPVILLDMRMPAMSGMDIAAKLQESNVRCKCIMITSHTTEYFTHETTQFFPIFKYLFKPLVTKDLTEAIQEATQELEKDDRKAELEESREAEAE